MADEPTGNVDPDMAVKLLRLFEALNRLGTTIVVATHDIHLMTRIKRAQMMRLEGGPPVRPDRSIALSAQAIRCARLAGG